MSMSGDFRKPNRKKNPSQIDIIVGICQSPISHTELSYKILTTTDLGDRLGREGLQKMGERSNGMAREIFKECIVLMPRVSKRLFSGGYPKTRDRGVDAATLGELASKR